MDSNSKIRLLTNHFKVCCCCTKEEGFKDISTKYHDDEESETYEAILKNTFNIQIYHQLSNDVMRFICSQCIIRLQDANTFKQMVEKSQETFLEYIQSLEHYNEETELKLETIKIEEPMESISFDTGYGDLDDDFDDDEILANFKQEPIKIDAVEALNSRKQKCDEKESISLRCKKKELKIVSESDSPSEKDWSKIAERRGTGPLLRENSLKLIQNSTICVFQWNKSRYRCFCCKEPFSDIDLLKEHTNSAHNLENIEKKIISQQNRLVKAEISSLQCKICHENVEDLSMLKQHLSEKHGMSITENLLLPFKIETELKCQICFEKFTVFRLLNMHMNKHFQKQICHICGAGFSNLVFLNLHKTRSHRPLLCKQCNINFNSKTAKKDHDIEVHNFKSVRKLRFPCPFCSERFFQENFRVRHLVETHGIPKPEFRCSVCCKSFLTKSLCNNHVKNVHNKEKNHECDVCHNFFYSKSDLARHKVTHTGEKKFGCELCHNLFATRDSLRRHMKRTHVGAN